MVGHKGVNMSEKKYSCPFCGSVTFYIPIDMVKSYFFYVTPEGVKPTPRSEGISSEGLDFSDIYCIGCAWHGTLEEIKRSN